MEVKEIHRENCRISYYGMMNAKTREDAKNNSEEYFISKEKILNNYQEEWQKEI